MKPPIRLSLFPTLVILLLHILPYAFLSCGDINNVQSSPTAPDSSVTANPVQSTEGDLKLVINFTDNRPQRCIYAMLMQANDNIMVFALHGFPPPSYMELTGIRTVSITRWRPGTFWGRIITGTHLTDSMCCTSVRYIGATNYWYLENSTDTIKRYLAPNVTVNCYEKCPYEN